MRAISLPKQTKVPRIAPRKTKPAAARRAAAKPAAMSDAAVRGFFTQLRRDCPEPKTELHYRSPFELLVAVLLSAQATDKSVNAATDKLFATAGTPAALLQLGEQRLQSFIRHIGLYRTKARHLLATCRLLIERHSARVPGERAALQSLPGIGRKSANVLLNTLFGQAVIAVDTHILRLSNRSGLASGKTPEAVESDLMRRVPAEFRLHAHHWLVLHGRYVCQARRPRCGECSVRRYCTLPNKPVA